MTTLAPQSKSAPFHGKLERASLMRAITSPQSAISNDQSSMINSSQPTQLAFTWDYPHQFPLLTVSEVAENFDIAESQVRKLCDDASLVALFVNVDDHPQREHLRIHRATCARGIRSTTSGLVDVWKNVPDWLFVHARPTLNVGAIATLLRISGQQVRELHDAGKLHGNNTSVAAASLEHLRFHRDDLIAFVRARLALKNNLADLLPTT